MCRNVWSCVRSVIAFVYVYYFVFYFFIFVFCWSRCGARVCWRSVKIVKFSFWLFLFPIHSNSSLISRSIFVILRNSKVSDLRILCIQFREDMWRNSLWLYHACCRAGGWVPPPQAEQMQIEKLLERQLGRWVQHTEISWSSWNPSGHGSLLTNQYWWLLTNQ